MDDQLKELTQELCNTIKELLRGSEEVAEAVGKIEEAGFDILLVLEFIITFEEKKGDSESSEEEMTEGADPENKIRWTGQDHKFLKTLKISPDEEK